MTMDQVTQQFKDELCNVTVARIRMALDGSSAANPSPLSCSVAVRVGSVIAASTVVLPAATAPASISAAVSSLSANVAQDITSSAVLAAFGPIDPPDVAAGTVDRVPDDVAPVVSDIPTIQPPTASLALQTGAAVELDAVFVLTSTVQGTIVKSRAAVTGFTADDVAVVAQHDDGTVLPMTVAVEVVPNDWYRLTIRQDLDGWPLETRDSCDVWTLTVTVPAGAALTDEGDATGASSPTAVPWRPGSDDVCGEIDKDKGIVSSSHLGVLCCMHGLLLHSWQRSTGRRTVPWDPGKLRPQDCMALAACS